LVIAGLVPALVCVVLTQVSFLLKQRGACAAAAVRFDQPFQSARSLMASPWFALGMATAVVAWILHVAAIASAPLSTVQAVLASGVVVLAIFGRLFFGWTISRRQWQGMALTAASLVVLVVSLPAPRTQSEAGPAGLLFVVSVLMVVAAFVAASRLEGLVHLRGAVLGAAAGTLLGISDVANKALTHVAGDGALAFLASPWLVVTVLASVSAFLVSGRAFQERDAIPVMASASTAANLTAMLGGIAVFGDTLSSSEVLSVVQVAAFAVIAAATLLTASCEPRSAAVRLAV
jgi:multidrug transporter EmrE-like cation transporter